MKKGLLLILLLMPFYLTACATTHYTACQSTYALCTKAVCTPVPGQPNWLSCRCDVKTGYSAATQACQPIQQTPRGKIIYSRYYPIKHYVVCHNNRPWGWCLNSPCFIDKHNPSKAYCKCSVVRDKGDYIIVTDKVTPTTCTSKIYSSATVDEASEVTDYLKTQPQLQPEPITVYQGQ